MLAIETPEIPCAIPLPSGEAARPRPGPSRFVVVGPGHPQRAEVEAFIAGIFGRHYGARITHWSPWLVALFRRDRPIAAAGYRRAGEPLYLERYLDAPIEDTISAAHRGRAIVRPSIVEVGHFASTYPGDGRRLLRPLARHLATLDCHWVTFTATRELRTLFKHFGLVAPSLGRADPARLGPSASAWGRYFEHKPFVLAGELQPNLARLEGTPR